MDRLSSGVLNRIVDVNDAMCTNFTFFPPSFEILMEMIEKAFEIVQPDNNLGEFVEKLYGLQLIDEQEYKRIQSHFSIQ